MRLPFTAQRNGPRPPIFRTSADSPKPSSRILWQNCGLPASSRIQPVSPAGSWQSGRRAADRLITAKDPQMRLGFSRSASQSPGKHPSSSLGDFFSYDGAGRPQKSSWRIFLFSSFLCHTQPASVETGYTDPCEAVWWAPASGPVLQTRRAQRSRPTSEPERCGNVPT